MSELPYDKRSRHLNLFSVKGSLLKADLIYVWKIFNGESPPKPDDLFVLLSEKSTREV